MSNDRMFTLFKGTLHSIFLENGFQPILEPTFDDNQRYNASYERSCSQTLQGRRYRVVFDVIAIPMSSTILICRGAVRNGNVATINLKVNANDSFEAIIKAFRQNFVFKLIDSVSPTIDQLLPELKIKVLLKLPITDIGRVACLNHCWYQSCGADLLWRLLLKRDFPDLFRQVTNKSVKNWRELYKEEYLRTRRQTEYLQRRSLPSPPNLLALPPALPLLPGSFRNPSLFFIHPRPNFNSPRGLDPYSPAGLARPHFQHPHGFNGYNSDGNDSD
ncbi:F-box only protein 7-like protein [Dinothrombium tinctorium]|uniref:F-box only protein 7-like protein n=1 Tax=Dinothrombium tinctorium TaxID=1965070 RepID=A0A443RP89_9ACAR|nr:F-box only protein 7-like protein [Dinothrombium tinctorium]